jgi:hypothetical protein
MLEILRRLKQTFETSSNKPQTADSKSVKFHQIYHFLTCHLHLASLTNPTEQCIHLHPQRPSIIPFKTKRILLLPSPRRTAKLNPKRFFFPSYQRHLSSLPPPPHPFPTSHPFSQPPDGHKFSQMST